MLEPDILNLDSVPLCHHDINEFSKSKATSLPPHRPYDCGIDLLPGTTPPKGRLYSLSAPENQAMREYIQASLKASIIRPSSSPGGAGLFLLVKRTSLNNKDGNNITVRTITPFPSSFQHLSVYKEPNYSPSWIWETHITWFGYEKERSGRQHLILLRVTTNT